MKKLISFALAAIMAFGVALNAKTADELRIYINPGHGSWTGNDRPNPIIGHKAYDRYTTDTLNFFESNTNLRKGFGVLERLIDYGLKFDRTLNQTGERWQIGAARDLSNNIVMSHVKCGPFLDDNATSGQYDAMIKPLKDKIDAGTATAADIEEYNRLYNLRYVVAVRYNRNLSEICQEVDANDFDMFISIHSNAATDGTSTNYLLFEYRGYDDLHAATGLTAEHQQLSRKMAETAWGYAFENPFMAWTSYSMTNKNVRGDINFNGSGSTGVTGAYGYLGVLKHHAPGYLVEGYFHTYQPDRHRAMNFDVCRVEGIAYAHGLADYFGLQKESFGTVYGIVRDLHEKFTHDYYKPNASTDDVWKPINGCKVTLKKGDEVVAEYTTDEQYNGAFVFDRVEPGKYTLTFEHSDYKAIDPVEVEVKAATVSYPSVRLENVEYVPPTKVVTDYPDPAAEMAGLNAADQYVVKDVYTDEPIAELEGKIVRRAIVREGKMYILAIDKLPTYAQVVSDEEKPVPTIIVYDLDKKEVVATVSTEGTYGSIQNVSDIQVTADGYLLASNQTKTQYSKDYLEKLPDGTQEPRGTFYIYKWANDEEGLPTGNPEQWLSTQQSGRWFRAYAGTTFAYQGTTEDGQAIIVMPTISGPTYNQRWTSLTVANGQPAGASDILQPADNPNEQAFGEGYRYITSPVDTKNFLAVTPKSGVIERKFLMGDKAADLSVGNDELTGLPGTVGAFKYAGASYIVAPENKDGKNVGVRLVNITDNIANAASVPVTGSALEALEAENVVTVGETGYVYDDLYNVYTDAWIDLYVIRDGKISKLTTKTVKQPVAKAAFAYGLECEQTESNFNFTYSLSENAKDATLVLTPTKGNVYTAELEATKGQHLYSVAISDLDLDANYTWEVKVTPVTNANSDEIFTAAPPQTVRGSVITFVDPEYDSFGYTVIGHNVENGFDIYNPAGELVATGVHKGHKLHGAGSSFNQSNPLRGAEHMGHALVAAWGDAAWGVTAFNPLDTSEDLYSVFEGEKAGNGLISYNGVGIGSGTPCVAIQGKGENARMFTFDEDLNKNAVTVYNIGNNRTINTAPVANWGKQAMNNTNVEIAPVENGVFLSQVRSDFMDSGSPSIRFLDNNGKFVWDACDYEWPNDMIPNCGSGIAVNADQTLFAVAGYSGIRVFKLSFDAKNKPVFEAFASMKVPTTDWNTLRFDAANNIHYYGRKDGYHVFALSQPGAQFSTPGKDILYPSGVDEITVDDADENAPVEYYSISGVRVSGDNLLPGIYVKRQGKKVEKIIVK